ncbi:MAG: UDP-glucose 4-epimerase GalE [Bacilli bacterium]
MKICVCGGAGYIGSHCVKMLIKRGYSVVVVDNLSTGHLEAIDPQTKVYIGDIRDRSFISGVFQEESVDAVIHFCAKSLVGESMNDPLAYFDNNVTGTLHLLQEMVAHNVKKIIFSSSAAVYGQQEHMPLTEESPTIPTNPYGETKLAMEKMMKWADDAHQLKYVSLRYFNVAGAYHTGDIGEDHHPETHLIPIVLQTVLGKRAYLQVFGNDYQTPDGTCVRDYIHVEDLIEAHILALEYLLQGHDSNIFNLGSEQGYSVMEVIKSCERVTGISVLYQMGLRRLGDPDQLIASSRKIEKILGWKPRMDLDEMIRTAYVFHKSHIDGY